MKVPVLVNTVVMMGLALVVTLFTFLSFGDSDLRLVNDFEFSGEMVFDELFISTDISILRQNARDSVVLMPGTQAELHFDETTSHVNVDLKSGSVLFGTLAGDFTVSISSEYARVDSRANVAYVELDENALQVYALDHPAELSFILGDNLLNTLSVPSDHRVKIPASKVTETVGRLRLTKLSKEFPAFALKDDDYSVELLTQISAMDAVYTEASLLILNNYQVNSDFGPETDGLGGGVNNVAAAFEDVVTILPHAEERLLSESGGDALTYAVSNYLYGDKREGDIWLSEWQMSEYSNDELESLYASLFFVLPGDQLYTLKSSVAKKLYLGDELLDSLKRQYQEIESLLARSAMLEAEEAYSNYKLEFQNALRSGVFEGGEFLDEINREYVLLEILLRSNAVFYSVDDVELLSHLESTILSLSGSTKDLGEERQAFVQSKLRFLGNLFEFVIDKKVLPDDAEALANDLLISAQAYLGGISSEVAVYDYFNSELELYELSIDFMSSPEFYSYTSFEEGLASYSEKVKDVEELNAYLQEIRAGVESKIAVIITLEEAITEVGQALIYNQVQYADLDSLGDLELRLFEVIGGRTAGHKFEAKYDRITGLLYDLVVEEGLRFSTGITLVTAHDVIENALAEPELDEDEDVYSDESNGPSLRDGVAYAHAEGQFDEAGFDSGTLVLELLEGDTFSFSGELLATGISVEGVYNGETEKVSQVAWIADDVRQGLPSTSLANLKVAILALKAALETAALEANKSEDL